MVLVNFLGCEEFVSLDVTYSPFTSKNTVLCDNVQCDKKCNLLVQCDMKMIQYSSML